MHGQSPRSLDEKLVDKEESYRWLKFEDINGETESTVVVALSTTNLDKNWKNLKVSVDYVKNTRNYRPPNFTMLHFGKEWIQHKTW
jgi:hypothetical protein